MTAVSAAKPLSDKPQASSPPAAEVPLKQRILLVEDNDAAREDLRQLIEKALGVVVDTAADGAAALEALGERTYSILLTDLRMPGIDGLELIEEVRKSRMPVTVIVTTGHGSIDGAVQAMRLGATDFLTKPIDLDHLRLVLERALRERQLQDEVASLREQLEGRYAFQNIISKSPRMHAVFELIGHLGPTTSTVLIEGETGTGKEVVARAIHQASSLRHGPLVAVNCAAIPETLLESELFGHEKGSFTGAVTQRKGRFELADGGTLFLDEVGDIPAAMQAKLLRVLQERTFERVGGTKSIEVNVRVIAATNRSLKRLAEDGKFREDLYYRLNVVRIELPPLRARPEDIPLLAAHFAQKYARPGVGPMQLEPEAMAALMRHRWPGNIRELENAIARGCVTGRGEMIRLENLPPEIVRAPAVPRLDMRRPLTDFLADLTTRFEERYLRRALRKAGGNIARVARHSGLPVAEVAAKLAAYKLEPQISKPV
jgi:DNA-binding NtrC family response regulator